MALPLGLAHHPGRVRVCQLSRGQLRLSRCLKLGFCWLVTVDEQEVDGVFTCGLESLRSDGERASQGRGGRNTCGGMLRSCDSPHAV